MIPNMLNLHDVVDAHDWIVTESYKRYMGRRFSLVIYACRYCNAELRYSDDVIKDISEVTIFYPNRDRMDVYYEWSYGVVIDSGMSNVIIGQEYREGWSGIDK